MEEEDRPKYRVTALADCLALRHIFPGLPTLRKSYQKYFRLQYQQVMECIWYTYRSRVLGDQTASTFNWVPQEPSASAVAEAQTATFLLHGARKLRTLYTGK